jgi:hypothetical protein
LRRSSLSLTAEPLGAFRQFGPNNLRQRDIPAFGVPTPRRFLNESVVVFVIHFYGDPFSHAACLAHVIYGRSKCT